MTDPRPWHEIIEDVPEIRHPNVEVWSRPHGGEKGLGYVLDPARSPCPVIGDVPEVCEALLRDKACEWLARVDMHILKAGDGWGLYNIGETFRAGQFYGGAHHKDRDACIRLAVDAVRGE